jgi:hypothetical protein
MGNAVKHVSAMKSGVPYVATVARPWGCHEDPQSLARLAT